MAAGRVDNRELDVHGGENSEAGSPRQERTEEDGKRPEMTGGMAGQRVC
jgi:hypothetical protein